MALANNSLGTLREAHLMKWKYEKKGKSAEVQMELEKEVGGAKSQKIINKKYIILFFIFE